ncbi:minor capsid protein [Bacillus sp. PS93]|uniref:minor capsid protein n=1 Tax=Bacillus TaxID=1386 RepID=UPI0005A241CE|nr:minor capsid protein [Bacillus subtilis]KMN94571.1 hypothetical protein VL08_13085 [Bacillus subtilis]MCB4338640.1 hypothetical protein [Bacillus subtilis]MDX6157119.1 minor capsid protein [Bacillus subtilis]MEC2202498.1 minor capsid protein [Bacillus subtilis]QCY75650.1 minor capsid protein [Bacillus subtilis]
MAGFNVNINLSGVLNATSAALDHAQIAIDQQVLKDGNFYAPQDTGELKRSGIRASHPGSGKVIWDTKYASKVWNARRVSLDRNPNAKARWAEVAAAEHKGDWITVGQNAVNAYLRR